MKSPSREELWETQIRKALKSSAARGVDGELCLDGDEPWEEALALEEDDQGQTAADGADSEELMRQRLAAARVIFRYFLADGPHPASILKRVFAVGRGLGMEFFCQLTMTEAGMLCGETKAAHSWRMQLLSGQVRLRGQHGARFAGQNTSGSSLSYEASARGNQNRRKKRQKTTKK